MALGSENTVTQHTGQCDVLSCVKLGWNCMIRFVGYPPQNIVSGFIMLRRTLFWCML